ncbi:MAG: hypothetical protein JWQ39_1022 [Glaciihabitans sp.]|jgi:hypothetical protein|nr:hypothetical protein [Glaciihabitans sp.]
MIDGQASLVISSDTYAAADVTKFLGIDPDWSAEKGDLRPRTNGGIEPIRRRFYETSMWALEVDASPATMMAVDDDESKGFGTLQVLVDRLLGRGEMLAHVRQYYSAQLSWYGTAAGSQASFVLPGALIRDIGELGLDVVGTVYPRAD